MDQIIDFEALPAYQPRTFVPNNVDLSRVDEIKRLFQLLIDEPIDSRKELETWMAKRFELEAAIEQTGSILYIRMTCQTDDPAQAKAYQRFIEEISPVVEELEDKMDRKYLAALESFPLDAAKYEVYNRALRADVELFRDENIPVRTQVSLSSQEYQTVSGAMTVEFDGKERTMPEMGKYLLETDRQLRQRAWMATAQRRLQDKDKLEDLFDHMLKLRHQVALNAGCANYMEYTFRAMHRFDYTPGDCRMYHDSVEKLVVPTWKEILERRKSEMKLVSLKPWDLAVDSLGRPALHPFTTADELLTGCRKIVERIDPVLGKQFSAIADDGLLDLVSRKGKAPGGYQTSLSEARKPFIFMNSVGLDGDVRTLLHEAGHAFHTLACRDNPILPYHHGPMEFNEVASMSMEMLATDFLDAFYKPEDANRSNRHHLEDVVFVLGWVATVDAFQHWIYEHPQHSRVERQEMWLKISNRFSGNLVDWTGLEEFKLFSWHKQLHIFEYPFYYIEYGIAQLGALQLWQNARRDWKGALEAYRRGLALGGSKPLPEIYAAAGIRFDFSAATIGPLMENISRELQKY